MSSAGKDQIPAFRLPTASLSPSVRRALADSLPHRCLVLTDVAPGHPDNEEAIGFFTRWDIDNVERVELERLRDAALLCQNDPNDLSCCDDPEAVVCKGCCRLSAFGGFFVQI